MLISGKHINGLLDRSARCLEIAILKSKQGIKACKGADLEGRALINREQVNHILDSNK